MAFLDDVFTWLMIFALGAIALIYKIKPELDRRKKEYAEAKTKTVQPKAYDAKFKELP